MKKFSKLIVRFRWYIIVAVLLLTGFFSYQLKYLEVESNVVNALPETDSIVRLFNDVGKRFGSNEIGLIIIESNNVFEPGVLEDIRRVTDTLSEMEGITSVRSLTNMTSFNVEGDNFEVDDLISEWPENEADAEKLKEKITKNKLVSGTLASEDGTSTLIIFNFESGKEIDKIAENVFRKINDMHLKEKVYFAGSTFLTAYIAEIISGDMMKLIPISFLLIALILYMNFHSVRGVVMPLLTAALAIIWAIGLYTLMGFKLSMVTNNVPIIILAVGSAYAIHVLNRVMQNKKKKPKKAIINALSLITLPVILTALTTMVGFLSFIFGAYLSMIRDFGILAAMGTFFSAFLALIFVPALLAVSYPRKKGKKKAGAFAIDRKSKMNTYFLFPLYKLIINHPKRIVLIWVVLVLVGIGGIFKLKRSVSVSDYFKSDHPASIADHIMEEKYGGSKPLYIVFKGNIQSPEVLKGMYNFEQYLLKSPYVTGTQSVADIVKMLNKALAGEDKIPDDEMSIQQLWFLMGQQDMSQLVSEDLDEAVVMAKFSNEGQENMKAFRKYVKSYLDTHKPDDYTIQLTGMPYVNEQLDKSLVRSQTTSLIIAVILVIAIVSLIFRSIVEGLYASAPIISTIAILYGFMGLAGMPLNIVTVLVASVAMGIGIDYSIHFISNFNLSLKKHHNIYKAVQDAVLVSGKAIMINFFSVSAGFLVLVFSDLMPMVYFGFLIALSMFGSSMGALTLLPATILLGNRKLIMKEAEHYPVDIPK